MCLGVGNYVVHYTHSVSLYPAVDQALCIEGELEASPYISFILSKRQLSFIYDL